MTLKNWLIRTKNKQILGPATKEKVIELIEKGSLTNDDEITCGNGYWVWVREKDLLEKYLYGDLPQTFNPISEAQDVLTAKSSPDGVTASVLESPQRAKAKSTETDTNQLPDQDDLAYPDMDDLDYPDSTPDNFEATDPLLDSGEIEANETAEIEVGKDLLDKNLSEPMIPKEGLEDSSSDEEENYLYPEEDDLEYPEVEGDFIEEVEEDITDPNVKIPIEASLIEESYEEQPLDHHEEELAEELPKKKNVGNKKKVKKRRKVITERKGNDRYLLYIAFFIVVAIGFVIYYYKAVLNKPIPIIGMQEAHAQTIQSLSKKKTFIP